MHRILAVVVHTRRSLLRSRFDLAMENVALRQQLAVMKQRRTRPRLRGTDRRFWVVLCRVWSGTAHPTAEWIIQQLREAFPFDTAPRYLILDRDGKYGSVVPEKLRSWGVKLVRTGWRSPWQNGEAERWVQSARRELLDHVVVFNEAHLRRLLAEYVSYYNIDRCHHALDKDAPEPRGVRSRPTASAKVVALPRVGGIHPRYEWSDRPRLAA
jgi:hypothetical protein